MFKKQWSVPILVIAFLFQPVLYASPKNMYAAIQEQHVKSFHIETAANWDENSFYKFVVRYFREQKNPTVRNKRELAFNVLKSNANAQANKSSVNTILDQNSWEDLNLFFNKSGAQHCLAEVINRATTEIGRVTLYRMLAEPCANIDELKKRQAIIRELIENEKLFQSLSEALHLARQQENLLLAFWDTDALKGASRSLYYEIEAVQYLNNSQYALAAKHLLDNGQRLTFLGTNIAATVILPLYTFGRAIKYRNAGFEDLSKKLMALSGPVSAFGSMIENPWVQGFISLGSAACCGLWAMGIYDWQRGSMALTNVLRIRMQHVGTFMNAINQAGVTAASNPILKDMPAVSALQQFFAPDAMHTPGVKQLLDTLDANKISSLDLLATGKLLSAFKQMNDHKDKLIPAIAAFGELDAYLAIAKLYKEFNTERVNFTFAQYLDAERPYIRLTNFWNPFINPEKVVSNSIELGGAQRNNMIVTGPNAGGKSTTLKGIAICLIMAQTFGIVPAQEAVITPFTKIASYLNITDDIVAGHSLFKAEVMRAHNLIETVEKLGPKQFSFVILDEIFNGTSPHEGAAAAYGTAKHLGTFDRSIAIVATHFSLLTDLEKISNSFTNYRVRVNKQHDGRLEYPFTIEHGISDQNVALDMLRLEGFKGEILKEAENILRQRRT